MKKALFLVAMCCLFAVSAFAQKSQDFSGTWTLDVSKSKLDERARIESITLSVAQTDKEIKIDSKTTRSERPEGAPGGMGGGGGMGRGGGFGMGDGSETYSLDGKETKATQEGPRGSIPVIFKAKSEGGTLELSSSRTFSTQMGEITATKKEVWSLSNDGKTLTVVRENTTPRGTNSSTLVFVKK